eukprot:4785637-Amphidinium_carterae.1
MQVGKHTSLGDCSVGTYGSLGKGTWVPPAKIIWNGECIAWTQHHLGSSANRLVSHPATFAADPPARSPAAKREGSC